jgi:AcrR family transcriptional regulator
VIDGRSARAVRTRRSIVDALLALIESGELKPAAPRIAERAGVSLRSIYQHFDDLEALFAAASERFRDQLVAQVTVIRPDGPLESRLDAFVTQRGRVLEAITPVRRASLLQEPFSEQLRASRDFTLELARSEVARVFRPELATRSGEEKVDTLNALDAAGSWSTWDFLRQSGLDPSRATAVMRLLLSAVLGAAVATSASPR